MKTIGHEELKAMILALAAAAGIPEEDGAILTESILQADMRGIHSHGVLRLPLYLKRVCTGAVNAKPQCRILQETMATALLDGDHGLGQISGHRAMHLAMEKAEGCGIGAVAVRRGHHFGAAAYYAMMAEQRDMIGIALTNTPPLMAAWGGKTRMVGNNPFAVYVPAGEELPILLDMALSQVAQGKISLAAAKGERIPQDWSTDAQGNPTTDPLAALHGILLPSGGHKGFGLAVVIDLLTGVLSGAQYGAHVRTMSGYPDEHQDSGQLYIAIRIEAFRSPEAFKKDVDAYIREMKSAPKAEWAEAIYLPGEQSFLRYRKNIQEGIELPDGVIQDLRDAAEMLKVDLSAWL
jgi:LDH2 family malate/lactate/ureidoglycolate dehydrogenase